MKLLIIALMVLSVFETMAVDADFSGEVRFRLTTGSDDLSGDGVMDQLTQTLHPEFRTKISSSFRASESFEANASMYLNQSGLDIGLSTPSFFAYGDWMISDEFMVRLGTTQYEVANGLVIGSNDFQMLPTMLSGAILTYSSESIGVDLGVVKGFASTSIVDFGNLLIASIDIRSLSDAFKDANLHVIVTDINDYVMEEGESSDDAPIYAGATVGGDMMDGLSYSVTASVDSVNPDDIGKSYLVDGYIKYKMELDNSAMLKLYVGGHADGADYAPLYYDVHRNAGKLDVAQFGNGLIYGKAGAYYMMDSNSALGISGHYFHKGNKTVEDGDIEVDLSLKNKINSSVSSKIVAGVLKQGDSYKGQAYANLSMKF